MRTVAEYLGLRRGPKSTSIDTLPLKWQAGFALAVVGSFIGWHYLIH